jgi:hypothetical protein
MKLVLVDHGRELRLVVAVVVEELALERVPALRLLLSPSPVLAEGSQAEMERLAARFEEAGATVRIA